MKKILRYSLLSLLALFVTAVSAQKQVTVNFDNDYQTLFPTLAGTSSGSGESYVNAGDFTEATTAIVGDLMLIVSPDEGASTPSRIWSSSPRLRMYSGAFVVMSTSGSYITKIEFTGHKTNFNMAAMTGTLEDKTWTGNDQRVMFTVSKNTQISSMVVTIGGEAGPDNPDEPDDPDDPLAKFIYKSGTVTESSDGSQVFVDYVATNADAEITGRMVFDFENNLCTKLAMSANFPTAEMAQAYYEESLANKESEGLETVTIFGMAVTVTMKQGYENLSKIAIKSMMKFIVDNETGGIGILENPMTPNQANMFAGTQESNKVSEENVYVKGKIASISFPFDTQHGTATFAISADGKNDFTFLCYSVNYLENKAWVNGNTQIQVGDDVIICGKLVNYNGVTPETASKQAYIYSLNGKTQNEGGDTPDPEVNVITVAKALEVINGLSDNETTTEKYQVKGFIVGAPDFQRKGDGSLYGNVNSAIADQKGGSPLLTVYRGKSFNNQGFTEETISLLKEGDEVVFEGQLQKFLKDGVYTLEIKNCYVISINGKDATGINHMKADTYDGAVYNLGGLRVSKKAKGILIRNGKKYIVK